MWFHQYSLALIIADLIKKSQFVGYVNLWTMILNSIKYNLLLKIALHLTFHFKDLTRQRNARNQYLMNIDESTVCVTVSINVRGWGI